MSGWNTPIGDEEGGVVRVVLGRDVPYPDLKLDYPEQEPEPDPQPIPPDWSERLSRVNAIEYPEAPRQAQGLSDPSAIRRRYLDRAVELATEIVTLIGRSLDHLDVYDSNAPGEGLEVKLSEAAEDYLARLKEYQGRAERLEE